MVGTDIIEWGYCLDDCPFEEPVVVCQSDPPLTPTLILEPEDGYVNYTTEYTFGLNTLNKEVTEH